MRHKEASFLQESKSPVCLEQRQKHVRGRTGEVAGLHLAGNSPPC